MVEKNTTKDLNIYICHYKMLYATHYIVPSIKQTVHTKMYTKKYKIHVK